MCHLLAQFGTTQWRAVIKGNYKRNRFNLFHKIKNIHTVLSNKPQIELKISTKRTLLPPLFSLSNLLNVLTSMFECGSRYDKMATIRRARIACSSLNNSLNIKTYVNLIQQLIIKQVCLKSKPTRNTRYDKELVYPCLSDYLSIKAGHITHQLLVFSLTVLSYLFISLT